ncbi:hypothetical protein KJ669_00640 [Patescibacteria group bacterium]|nr:hypothetical protein [Patescibacteria group bacterium]MBU2194628.1 hypothetical protein [Patescibacteria group bacterium]
MSRYKKKQLARETEPDIGALFPVEGRVSRIAFHKGYAILETADGEGIFLWLCTLRKFQNVRHVSLNIGDVVSCETLYNSKHGRLNVTKVLSIHPSC